MSNRKRSRSVQEKKHAGCPFTITYAPGPSRADEGRRNNKKRKHNDQDGDKEFQIQISPFSPTGSFKAHDSLDVSYTVEPAKRWQDMTRYNSFVFNSIKYYREGFVHVANESTVNDQKATNDGESGYKKSNGEWVARILEIRASDEHHVYVRVYWMYWPDELPPGRQPYHGTNELIASNHMDIINVVSVTAPAIVKQWIESDDEEIAAALYWRQAYDCRKPQLSSVDIICKCETPANPDKMLIGCSSSECGQWMHHECLAHDILMQVYARLGTDKLHRTYGAVSDEEEAKNVTCHLPPTGAEEKEAIHTIDVHSEKSRGNIHVKQIVPETPLVTRNSAPRPTPSKSIIATPAKRPAKNDNKKKMGSLKPYAGLFEANLNMRDGPTVWVIRDLRESVTGGEKTWTEKVHCLICGAVIN
ncbi:hypothetical protein FOYG_16948 [Fusarium oxysporum NRRL 32931]|uniref:BAH domain-containing protein n=1 Tax=Fusarium oxysporum NRRL 32931 TaxID=660029 RepID=W9HBF3_FUSOX|nr:hypothetical protein FOYG_16948 [Fusarium oxysporum NRRL 32931]